MSLKVLQSAITNKNNFSLILLRKNETKKQRQIRLMHVSFSNCNFTQLSVCSMQKKIKHDQTNLIKVSNSVHLNIVEMFVLNPTTNTHQLKSGF